MECRVNETVKRHVSSIGGYSVLQGRWEGMHCTI